MKKFRKMSEFTQKETITLTFGECAENHVGMEKLGEIGEEGYSFEELLKIKNLKTCTRICVYRFHFFII